MSSSADKICHRIHYLTGRRHVSSVTCNKFRWLPLHMIRVFRRKAQMKSTNGGRLRMNRIRQCDMLKDAFVPTGVFESMKGRPFSISLKVLGAWALLLVSACATPYQNHLGFDGIGQLRKSCFVRSGPGRDYEPIGNLKIGSRVRFAELATVELDRWVLLDSDANGAQRFLDSHCLEYGGDDPWIKYQPSYVQELDLSGW